MAVNTHKNEARTYVQVWGGRTESKHEQYNDTFRIEYNVHNDNIVEYSSNITLTREQAEQLLRDLQEHLYGIKQ